MRKTKEQKAITLIALIITIVVLLILAVVAINAVTGDGIIQHATNAKTEYEKAQDEEQDILSYYEQYLETEGKTGDWIQDKTIVKNVKTGQELHVGQTVKNYGQNDSYTWKVLGAEKGELLLTTKELINEAFVITREYDTWNSSEYRFAELENALDEECRSKITELGEATLVRSIKVEDINRVTGYNPIKQKDGSIYKAGQTSQYGNKITYTLSEDGTINYSVVTINGEETSGLKARDLKFIRPDGATLMSDEEWEAIEDKTGLRRENSIEILANYYEYMGSDYLEDSEAYELLFNNGNYFLASSNVSVNDEAANANFGIRYIYNGNVTRKSYYRTIELSQSATPTSGVRAVASMVPEFKPEV